MNMGEVTISKEDAKKYVEEYAHRLENVDNIEDLWHEDIIIITDNDIEKLRNGMALKYPDGDFDHFLVYRK